MGCWLAHRYSKQHDWSSKNGCVFKYDWIFLDSLESRASNHCLQVALSFLFPGNYNNNSEKMLLNKEKISMPGHADNKSELLSFLKNLYEKDLPFNKLIGLKIKSIMMKAC
jgi:hypothetical protein